MPSLSSLFTTIILLTLFPLKSQSIKCHGCIGKNCEGSTCEGDYCVVERYSPKLGSAELSFETDKEVSGCIHGSMIRKNVTSHCETVHDNGKIYTCFCDTDFCNEEKVTKTLPSQPLPLFTCICKGDHCRSSSTCIGEYCSFVINHKTSEIEQGCINASVPLIERRATHACMIPPMTGAMHHTSSNYEAALLNTESCLCGSDFCNSKKPEYDDNSENMKCNASFEIGIMGNHIISSNLTCSGEYCYKAEIASKIGFMSFYKTQGCITFITGAEIAKELNPIGCAEFSSASIQAKTCFVTDIQGLDRANANQKAFGFEQYRKNLPRKIYNNPITSSIVYSSTASFYVPSTTYATTSIPKTKTGISVYGVIFVILLAIILTGIIYKFELYKRLPRPSYNIVGRY